MKKILLILMALVVVGIGSQDSLARAALEKADSKLPSELKGQLSPSELEWVLDRVNNLKSDDALVIMGEGFGYGMKGYTAYIQLSSWQKLFAVMYFAELLVGSNRDEDIAILIKVDAYKEFLQCSNALAGKLASIKSTSIQKLRQEQLEEELEQERKRAAEQQRKKEYEEKQKRDNDSLYVVDATRDVRARSEKQLKKLVKSDPDHYKQYYIAYELCRRYGWPIPDELTMAIEIGNKVQRQGEFWIKVGTVGIVGVAAAVPVALIVVLVVDLLSPTE